MNTTDILIAARAKVEQGWTQKVYARDKAGNRVDPYASNAVCWCMGGAVLASFRGVWLHANKARKFLYKVVGHSDYTIWNDQPGRTQAEVLQAFDSAIELSKLAERENET